MSVEDGKKEQRKGREGERKGRRGKRKGCSESSVCLYAILIELLCVISSRSLFLSFSQSPPPPLAQCPHTPQRQSSVLVVLPVIRRHRLPSPCCLPELSGEAGQGPGRFGGGARPSDLQGIKEGVCG